MTDSDPVAAMFKDAPPKVEYGTVTVRIDRVVLGGIDAFADRVNATRSALVEAVLKDWCQRAGLLK